MWFDGVQHTKSSTHGGPRRGLLGAVIHYTGERWAASPLARWAATPGCPVSWHFLIDRDGWVIQQVDTDLVACHAGDARWGDHRDVNERTIGIELCNVGYRATESALFPDLVEYRGGFWEPYPEAQLLALETLLVRLHEDIGMPREFAGHEAVAVPAGRKIDPGPLFPWDRLGGQTRAV